MPNFRYRARDKFGKSVSGVMSGADRNVVASHLGGMGYVPVSIEESNELGGGLPKIVEIFSGVTLADINVFTRQLLTLQKAGVPLLAGLSIIEKQTKNKLFKDKIKEILADIEHGLSLSDAISKHPRLFDEFYINMIKAGEASGLMEDILARLLEFGEKEADTKSKIKAAVRYPVITLMALAGAFVTVVTFVIPKFSAVFAQFKTTLPLPTRILLGLSFTMRHYWYIIVTILAVLVFLFVRYINTKKGRLRWDSFKLKVPIFGPLVSMFAMARFTRTMSILLKSGLPILQVLDMAARTSDNAVISMAVDNIAASVKEGKGISEPMRLSGVFPLMVVSMVAIGEDTGKVDELLMSVSEYYDQQSDYLVQNLTTMLEPAFVLVLGAMVLLMALAIFLPMWNLITVFQH